jgi:hypothetical protein
VLRLDGHGYSPALLGQIVAAAAQLQSFQQAALALALLGGLSISPRHVGRLAHEIGTELAQHRDEQTVQHRRRQLPAQVALPPALAVVEVDGGRLFTRQPGCGPGVHQAQAKEDKIGCAQSLASRRHAQDPQPEPPAAFRDARRVTRLVQQVHGTPPGVAAAAEDAAAGTAQPPGGDEPWRGAPRRRLRTCVATLRNSQAFGPMLAAEAQRRNFYAAAQRAFVGDGQHYNWAIHRAYFADFEAIADFLHVLCYLYLAGWAVGHDEAERWKQYEVWLRDCWQGRVGSVIAALADWQERLGRPPPDEELDPYDARKLVAEALTYLQNNRSRMDYPRYRRAGLPVTSSLVESLVGEFNARVKGQDKHWNRPEEAEAILQLRAAVLSQDDRLARFCANRPGCPYRRRPERTTSK